MVGAGIVVGAAVVVAARVTVVVVAAMVAAVVVDSEVAGELEHATARHVIAAPSSANFFVIRSPADQWHSETRSWEIRRLKLCHVWGVFSTSHSWLGSLSDL